MRDEKGKFILLGSKKLIKELEKAEKDFFERQLYNRTKKPQLHNTTKPHK